MPYRRIGLAVLEPKHLPGQFGEEMEVIGQLEGVPARRAGRRHRAAVAFVDDDQVQVAVVAHLLAAELAKAQDGEPARLPKSRPLDEGRQAEPLFERRI